VALGLTAALAFGGLASVRLGVPLDAEARAWPLLHLRKFVLAGARPAGPAAPPPPRR